MITGWPRPIGCLNFIGQFLQNSRIIRGSFAKIDLQLKGGHEPLEKESHEFLGLKCDDRFSNLFFEMVPKTCQGSFFVPALA